ncbi:MAG: dihydroxyacetone kinase phosphoryl donor subunit DhaM, partial [Anaerolineales bacterium]
MVNLVIVSHSHALAEALAALARQVAPASLNIAIVGGIGEDHQDFGTNTVEIVEAIQSVYQEEGVLVFTDLGSAVLSAEMARDLLPEEQRPKIHLSAAPLVEGVLAAAVQASLRQPLAAVESEALQALLPKQEQLTEKTSVPQVQPSVQPSFTSAPNSIVVKLTNPHGLHARPAAQFVQTVLAHEAQVTVQKLGQSSKIAPGNSLNALTSLGATAGDEIVITAQGKHAQEVLQALQTLLLEKIPALETTNSITPKRDETTIVSIPIIKKEKAITAAIKGIPISEGIVIGPVLFAKRQFTPPPLKDAVDPITEWKRLQSAIEHTQIALEKRYQTIAEKIGENQAAI